MLSFVKPSDAPRAPRESPVAKQAAAKFARPAAAPSVARPTPGPAPAAAPEAPAPALPAAGGVIAFEGDWGAFIEKLGLTGMAGMVARHGELVSFENGHLELVVPETHRMYAEKAYQEKLKAALVPHLGANLRITVRVGGTSGNSVAAKKSQEMAERQANAAEAIEDDPFVRDLVRDLGAEVVSSSIRPTEDGEAGQPSSQKR
jgi:DNA polymerase-3 subunit gamma/tau